MGLQVIDGTGIDPLPASRAVGNQVSLCSLGFRDGVTAGLATSVDHTASDDTIDMVVVGDGPRQGFE